jgi:predicted pyridoxine 5'-phosphate oxidase superfamily flavin-nucleotide-binding protein
VTSIGLDDLKTIYAPPSDRVVAKQLARIDRHAANFIGMSPFCVLATSGPDGTVDASRAAAIRASSASKTRRAF